MIVVDTIFFHSRLSQMIAVHATSRRGARDFSIKRWRSAGLPDGIFSNRKA
jgi:hypothetical protein